MKRITLTIEDPDTLLIPFDDSRFRSSITFNLTEEKFDILCDSLGALERASEILGEITEEVNL